MADALGVTDRDAMDGILRQLVRASACGDAPDEVNISFMISMVKNIRPRDSIEAMLVAQMVSVHVMAMRCAQQLATACDPARQDSAARALGRLARTFPAQIDALNRHRSRGEPAITVQNVSVGDGGKAIVGNVTQHASVVVRDKGAAAVVVGSVAGVVVEVVAARVASMLRSFGARAVRPRAGDRVARGGPVQFKWVKEFRPISRRTLPLTRGVRAHRAFRNNRIMPLICPTCQDVLSGAGGRPATVHGVVFEFLAACTCERAFGGAVRRSANGIIPQYQ
jgi:hypothetical protein